MAFERLGDPSNGEIISLRTAAREDDLGRFGPNQGGYGAPGIIDRGLCLLAIVMNTRCIAEKMLERAHHGVGGRRIDRCRRVVIEVDAHVHSEC